MAITKKTKINLGLIIAMIPLVVSGGIFVETRFNQTVGLQQHKVKAANIYDHIQETLLRIQISVAKGHLHQSETINPGKELRYKQGLIDQIRQLEFKLANRFQYPLRIH